MTNQSILTADWLGEDSVFGENYSGGALDQPGTSMILNESDDSL